MDRNTVSSKANRLPQGDYPCEVCGSLVFAYNYPPLGQMYSCIGEFCPRKGMYGFSDVMQPNPEDVAWDKPSVWVQSGELVCA